MGGRGAARLRRATEREAGALANARARALAGHGAGAALLECGQRNVGGAIGRARSSARIAGQRVWQPLARAKHAVLPRPQHTAIRLFEERWHAQCRLAASAAVPALARARHVSHASIFSTIVYSFSLRPEKRFFQSLLRFGRFRRRYRKRRPWAAAEITVNSFSPCSGLNQKKNALPAARSSEGVSTGPAYV